jgi:nitroimidazol reductase NimA-like FMN-containing flavoprotein (pyridoxamine 5'-phosphate oxidase superfamily)
MKPSDDPRHNADHSAAEGPEHRRIQERIGALVRQQRFAVLCTQGGSQPYGSVVAFSMNDELDYAGFATARGTQKYENLKRCNRVALVIDSRSAHPGELMGVEAITATGCAQELDAEERELWAALLAERHPELGRFIARSTTAVFRVALDRYLYVTRFQEVHHWSPRAVP